MGRLRGPAGPPPVKIDRQDYQAFERLLQNIQAAWSRHDLNALRAMVTPEMLELLRRAACRAGQPGRAQRGVRRAAAAG